MSTAQPFASSRCVPNHSRRGGIGSIFRQVPGVSNSLFPGRICPGLPIVMPDIIGTPLKVNLEGPAGMLNCKITSPLGVSTMPVRLNADIQFGLRCVEAAEERNRKPYGNKVKTN